MKKMVITMIALFTLFVLAPMVMAAPQGSSTVTRDVKARADGGKTETVVETTISYEQNGSTLKKITTTITTVTETAPDGFVESVKTHKTVRTETTRTSTRSNTEERTVVDDKGDNSSSNQKTVPKPYKDVKKNKIGAKAYTAIEYLRKKGIAGKIAKGKKFYPNKPITKKEWSAMLKAAYGEDAPVSTSKAKAKESWLLDQMVQVAANRGYTIRWRGRNRKVTRAEAARYLVMFAKYKADFAIN